MFFVNSGKTESQIANVVTSKYSNRDFECAESTDEPQRIHIQHLISLRKWSDAARRAGLQIGDCSTPLPRQGYRNTGL